ncbi:hypothetical protein C4Q28_10210 [Pseudomonas sp. SWI6]|uniref:Lipoprotein n=1 Tax=Pseudomonas taiwanensis TaxID=470150 RepID=A0ABR6V2D4_9PSED|nr:MULTISPECIES: hypothetical protein [Pseudomonas]MBC3474052.1 hypothetical protein [Pseudomonas taiwanensis]AGZ35995.1 hypothetical protein PVLB_16060 [Pseudomonas sp. VLB120]AVD82501.1 hypothetical protein C4Q28_10210 [Pseudomonas sp. SWI6]AVD89455.1 hypothetical protein C4Q26_20915 [Pseudomonas sp. SWI44]MBC3491438.1 hypothetical protein [Pseudomonas taiwanensis]
MKKFYLTLPLCAVFLQGCGVTMARYEPNYQNVQQLKQNAPLQPVQQAQVKADAGQGSLMVRLNPISSPEGSVPLHVQAAINDELRHAGLLDPRADRQLQIQLIKSQLNSGVANGHGELAARFTVRKGNDVLYETTKQVEHDWNSSFFGPIAIPAAANNYNPMLKDLLKHLYSDPQFIQALK